MTKKLIFPSRRDLLRSAAVGPALAFPPLALGAQAALAQPSVPPPAALAEPSRSALSLLDFIPSTLHPAIRAHQSTTPVHTHVQAWLDAIVASGRPGHIPFGRYVMGGTATWRKRGDTQGPILTGDGSFASVFAPVGVDDRPVLLFDGSSLEPYQHALHMRLADFAIKPPQGTRSGRRTRGIELIGMLYGDIDRVSVEHLTGDAFYIPRRADIHANPDAYTSQLTMRAVRVERCGGWAVNSTSAFGLNLKLEDPYFVVNSGGGVHQGGGLFYCERGTISFNGSAEALRAFAGNQRSGSEYGGGGICIVHGADGTSFTPRIVQTELDGNYGYNLWCQAAVGLITEQVKSNSNAFTHQENVLRPPRQFMFGFKNGAVLNYRSVNDAFRTKYLPNEPNTAVTIFAWDSTPGRVANHTVLNPFFPTADQTPLLTKYAPTRPSERVTIIEENRPVRETAEALVSRIVAAASLPAGTGIIAYERPEYDPFALYDPARGVFTAGSGGLYLVHATLALAGAAPAAELHVFVGDAPAATVRRRADGPETLEIQATLPLAAGDRLTIRGSGGGTAVAIEPGIALNRLTIRKLS